MLTSGGMRGITRKAAISRSAFSPTTSAADRLGSWKNVKKKERQARGKVAVANKSAGLQRRLKWLARGHQPAARQRRPNELAMERRA